MDKRNSEFETIKKKIANPASFGPGIWYCIHRLARDANTEEKKIKFKEFIENIIYNLPCTTCIEHATAYYKSTPLSDFWNLKENGKDVGLFRWAWSFHNEVNSRLKKPIIDWKNAKMLFSDEEGVCSSDCGKEEMQQQSSPPAQQSSQQSAQQSSSYTTHPNSLPVSMIQSTEHRQDPLQRFIPKNIIRPNSIEKSRVNKFRNV
jgi:hypothetical protein